MTGFKLFDCQQMFRHACAFADCADMAEAKFRHDTADIEWYTTPAIVNSAFACEVYLKAILLYNDIKTPNTHELKELFDLLPEDIRCFVDPEVWNTVRIMPEDPLGRSQIELISNAFNEWRYSYEIIGKKRASMSIDRSFLKAFRDALREACCRLFFKTTWEEYKQ